jgi:hypothetical protein
LVRSGPLGCFSSVMAQSSRRISRNTGGGRLRLQKVPETWEKS